MLKTFTFSPALSSLMGLFRSDVVAIYTYLSALLVKIT